MRYSYYKDTLKNYVKNNYKEYLLVCFLLLIGVFVGVMIINNCKDAQLTEITSYIKDFITKYKEIENINISSLIIDSIKKNLLFAIVLWVAGTTVIGMLIVLIMILLRGIILGFTVSSITIALGFFKGTVFTISSILLQNLLYIPAILTIGVSSIKLYKSIIKDKRRENIKIEIIRHTIISFFMVILIVISVFIESFISIKILKNIIKYF